jgi:hypothetical protein
MTAAWLNAVDVFVQSTESTWALKAKSAAAPNLGIRAVGVSGGMYLSKHLDLRLTSLTFPHAIDIAAWEAS